MSTNEPRQPPIWILSAAIGAGSVALAWKYLRGAVAPLPTELLPVPALILLLVVGCMAAEYFVVHLHFRSESVSFSFIAIPLILGAIFVSPSQVWAAMTMGAAVAFMLIRRQPTVKASFNTANYSMQAATALVIFHQLGAGIDPLSPQGWVAAAAAAVGSTIATNLTLSLILCLAERRIDFASMRQSLIIGMVTAFTSASLALIAATLIDAQPSSLLLLIAPGTVMFLAYRSFISQHEHRERVQHMHDSAQEIRAIRHPSAIPGVLANTAERMRAGRADLLLLPVDGSHQVATWYTAVGDLTETHALDSTQLRLAPQLAASAAQPVLLTEEMRAQLSDLLGASVESAMMGVVRSEGGVLGLLSVGDRLGDIVVFNDDDLTMFSTVVDQLTLALENNELEQAVSELKRVEQELTVKAHHDPLTGLANRDLFSITLTKALQSQSKVCVLYIDLDDFKLINDGLGHEAGDAVLVETARRLMSTIDNAGCVARLGGDEFAVILIDSRHDLLVANRLLDLVNQPITIGDHQVEIGASIGMARAEEGQGPDTLLAQADAAMYAAKGTNKGSVRLDRPTTPTRIRSGKTSVDPVELEARLSAQVKS